jgi:dihydrofolate synthase/folylpolyglutamate synthase
MARDMDYRDALLKLYSFTDYGIRGPAVYAPELYSLDRVRRFLALLGDPQHSFVAVHVAGTKGKGSTSAMAESILRAHGLRTGLYTSPHLHTFRERIRCGGELIPEADVIRLLEKIQPMLGEVPNITTFEVMTGLALAWFAERHVEWAVLEVGLGGRLDATNVIRPAVAIITSLSYDHTAVLGDTLSKIAREKAGIIKPDVPLVSAGQAEEALSVLEAACRQQGAPLTLVGRDWTWTAGKADLDGQCFTVHKGSADIADLWIPLLGEYQLENATTAIAALSLVRPAGIELPQHAIRDGLRALDWPGRLEILGRAPLVVADSAHNGDSANKLMTALRSYCDFRRLIVVLGASADHATPELMQALLSKADRAIATRARHPRAAKPEWLQLRGQNLGYQLELSRTVPHALEMALSGARSQDLVCCTGSVFVAAEARAAWFARAGLPLPPSDPV